MRFFTHNFNHTLLAQNLTLTLDTWRSELNNNIALIGASGRGKTRHFIKPNIMQMNCNYVISDPKGTLVLELGTMLEKNGYKIKVLNLVDMAHSDRYNPFCYVKKDSDIYTMIEFLMINVHAASTKDPFWDEAAKMLISAICFYLYKECRPSERTFANVLKMLRAASGTEGYTSPLDVMFEDLEAKDPEHIAVKQYKAFKHSSDRTALSILVVADSYLQRFNLAEYDDLTRTDTLDLEKLSTEKTAFFLITSDTSSSNDWLAGLFYSQLFDILCSRKNEHHIRFFLDDFACTGRIPDFERKMSMIRSRNLSCVIALQDEAQLVLAYGLAAKEIISNCDTYVFLGATNIDSCNDAAKRLCDSRITGADIRRMKKSDCVVVYGAKGGIYRKYDLTKHPRYAEIADDESSPLRYNLEAKHCVPEQNADRDQDRAHRRRLENSSGPVWLKDSLFDSFEEKYLYGILTQISDLFIWPHQHLRDIFVTEKKEFSKKLTNMHCDFVVRDKEMKVLFGIEIDGSQHNTDLDQIANDKLKDSFFSENKVPLLRFTAETVREDAEEIVSKVIEAATRLDCLERTFTGTIPNYYDARIEDGRSKHIERLKRTEFPEAINIDEAFEGFLSGAEDPSDTEDLSGTEVEDLSDEIYAPEVPPIETPTFVQIVITQQVYDKKHDDYWQSRKEFKSGALSAEEFEAIEATYKKFLDAIANGSIIVKGEE